MNRCRLACLLVLALNVCGNVHAGENPAGRTQTGKVGDALEVALPVIALGSSILIRDTEGAQQFLYGLGTTLAVSHGLKALISKERPDGRDEKSFPSSHTAIAMHTAAFVHERYGLKWGVPAYVAAAYVGHSRVHDERHDEQDVVAGAILGIVAARIFTSRLEGVEVVPASEQGVVGLSFRYRF